MDKDLKKIVKALEAQGFEVERTKKGRIAVYRDGRFVAMFAGSAGDWRAIKNGLASLKRAGFKWPP